MGEKPIIMRLARGWGGRPSTVALIKIKFIWGEEKNSNDDNNNNMLSHLAARSECQDFCKQPFKHLLFINHLRKKKNTLQTVSLEKKQPRDQSSEVLSVPGSQPFLRAVWKHSPCCCRYTARCLSGLGPWAPSPKNSTTGDRNNKQ